MGNKLLDRGEVLILFDFDEQSLFDIGLPPQPDTLESSNGGEDRSTADAALNATNSRQPMTFSDGSSPGAANVANRLLRAPDRRAANRSRIEPFGKQTNIPSIETLLMIDEVDDDPQ